MAARALARDREIGKSSMKASSNEDDDGGTLSPTSSASATMRSDDEDDDIEKLAVYKGVGLSHNNNDQPSFEDAIDNKGNKKMATADNTQPNNSGPVKLMTYKGEARLDSTHHEPPPQPLWKRHKFLLLGMGAVLIIVAIVISAVKGIQSSNTRNTKDGNSLPVVTGVAGIDPELLQSDAPTTSPTVSSV